jgi:hypothetical protein
VPQIELPVARRHLHEVEGRLARQQSLVTELESHHDARAIELGHELLKISQAIAVMARKHVEQLESLAVHRPQRP